MHAVIRLPTCLPFSIFLLSPFHNSLSSAYDVDGLGALLSFRKAIKYTNISKYAIKCVRLLLYSSLLLFVRRRRRWWCRGISFTSCCHLPFLSRPKNRLEFISILVTPHTFVMHPSTSYCSWVQIIPSHTRDITMIK